MSELFEVKTAELIGAALNWAVALAVRGAEQMPSPAQFKILDDYHPSTYWDQGGPLLSKFKVDLTHGESVVYATICTEDCEYKDGRGDTELVALCRAIVSAELSDVVQVPKELIND